MRTHIQGFGSLPHKQAWLLAWPMILSNISVPLMGLADTAMLGHLDNPIYLGAVAIGSNIIALLYWMFSFLRMGTTSVTAQAMGAKQPQLATLHLLQSGFLGLVFGLLLVAVQAIAIPFAIWLIAPDEALRSLASDYCNIRIYSAPAVLITYAAIGWLVGLGKTKLPLIIIASSNLLNIGLDYLFIVHWQWDVKGAAYATLIAEYTGCITGLLFAAYLCISRSWPIPRSLDLRLLKESLHLSADLFFRTLAILLVINFFNAQSAHYGNAVLAANAILFQGMLFAAFFLDGYALAGETLTANAIGSRDIHRFHRASAVTGVSALLIAAILTLGFLACGEHLIRLLTDITEVSNTAIQYLPWLILIPLASVGAYAFDGIFIGAGHTRTMRNTMIFSVIGIFFPAWWAFQCWGNHGLWFAFILFNISRGITLAYAYYRISKRQLW
ncbi:MAG: MATE family efflux transporter [Agarilytica sp.]